jgi:hypothetical protein
MHCLETSEYDSHRCLDKDRDISMHIIQIDSFLGSLESVSWGDQWRCFLHRIMAYLFKASSPTVAVKFQVLLYRISEVPVSNPNPITACPDVFFDFSWLLPHSLQANDGVIPRVTPLPLTNQERNYMELSPSWETASCSAVHEFSSILCGTRRFIIVFTRALHRFLSWARSIQSIPPHTIFLILILILFSRGHAVA